MTPRKNKRIPTKNMVSGKEKGADIDEGAEMVESLLENLAGKLPFSCGSYDEAASHWIISPSHSWFHHI
ncbi:hypothetical protein GOBAR_AA32445 [Gossypium barbadense]|uniref:Uncharacterized protein n=1 Tax=Gossypium barbadense TaxID=3634 RepID=A0A2P5WB07_GOSBA|nr:hypothetical protein GOBAR_AA32445 [Gossypium barbadense]